LKLVRQAQAVSSTLVKKSPDNIPARELGESNPDVIRALLMRALQERKTLLNAQPTSTAAAGQYAADLFRIANNDVIKKATAPNARALIEEGKATIRPVLASSPEDTYLRYIDAMLSQLLVDIYLQLDDLENAERILPELKRDSAKLFAIDPKSFDYILLSAKTNEATAKLAMRRHDWQQSKLEFEKGVERIADFAIKDSLMKRQFFLLILKYCEMLIASAHPEDAIAVLNRRMQTMGFSGEDLQNAKNRRILAQLNLTLGKAYKLLSEWPGQKNQDMTVQNSRKYYRMAIDELDTLITSGRTTGVEQELLAEAKTGLTGR
jgi:hypothetical protein